MAQQKELPLKHAPQPTAPAITAGDLMTRLYIFADDSMEGRETGTQGHVRSTQYIADELKKLGLVPAGDEGTFFQGVPMVNRSLEPNGTIAVGGATLTALVDFATTAGRGTPRSVDGAQVVYGGVFGDSVGGIAPEQTRGKVVLFRAPAENNFRIGGRVAQR